MIMEKVKNLLVTFVQRKKLFFYMYKIKKFFIKKGQSKNSIENNVNRSIFESLKI